MNYKIINLKHIDKSKLVDEVFYNQLRQDVQAAKVYNLEVYKEGLHHYSELRRLAVLIWGVGKKEEKYIRSSSIPKAPNFEVDLRRLEREREKEIAKAIRTAKDKEYRKEYKARSAGAKGDLLAAGFEEWTDFVPRRAITDRERLMEQVEGVWQRRQAREQTLLE